MTDRSIDDLFGECLRREQRLLVEPWERCDAREGYVERAAHLRRLLAALGVVLVQRGTPQAAQITADPIFWRGQVDGDPAAEILIRSDGGPKYSVLSEKGGVQKLETEFTMDSAMLFADRVLRRDKTVLADLKKPGVLTRLAAVGEIYRNHPLGVTLA